MNIVLKNQMRFRFFLLGLALMFVGTMGCGRKTLPVPPRDMTPPAVNDLSYVIEDEKVTLQWTLPGDVFDGEYGDGRAVVLRSKAKNEDLCPGCPEIFQRMARIPFARMDPETGTMVFDEPLEAGFHYAYLVVLEMKSGYVSDRSNRIMFEF